MPIPTNPGGDLGLYYGIYIAASAVLILWLGWVLHSAGRTFLADAFAGNIMLVRAVSQLLDIGFYLVSVGYVALTYQTYWTIGDLNIAFRLAVLKIGGLLLLLGVAHMFNLLLLAIFRRRGVASVATAGGGA